MLNRAGLPDRDEYEKRLAELRDEYYTFWAAPLPAEGSDFWRFHRDKLRELGHPLSWRIVRAVFLRG